MLWFPVAAGALHHLLASENVCAWPIDAAQDSAVSLIQTRATAVQSSNLSSEANSVKEQEADSRKQPQEMPWVVPPNDPHDWLFHSQTLECKPTVAFDIDAHSLASRIFYCAVSVLCFSCIAMWDTSSKHLVEKNEVQSPAKPERLWHLDFARVCAVMCVIFEHGGGMGYTRRNNMWGLWWALPFLYMTSGMAFYMSKSTITGYVMRLVCIFVIGVFANFIADLITHRNWKSDPFNTVFQMFFVVFLIAMAFMVEPLRQALQFRRNNPNAKATTGMMIMTGVWGFLAALGLCYYLTSAPLLPFYFAGNFGEYYTSVTNQLPLFLIEFCGTIFLCSFACVRSERDCSNLGWVVLCFIYVPSLLVPWHQEQFARIGALYVFGMFTLAWPLKGKQLVANAVQAYWPFLIMALCLISMPDMVGRCDMFPPGTTWERLRHRFGEVIMVVCFTTGSFTMSDPYNVMTWMNWWSLFAYVSHVAFYRVLGSPNGAVLSFGTIPVFFMIHHLCSKASSKDKAVDSNAK